MADKAHHLITIPAEPEVCAPVGVQTAWPVEGAEEDALAVRTDPAYPAPGRPPSNTQERDSYPIVVQPVACGQVEPQDRTRQQAEAQKPVTPSAEAHPDNGG